MAVIKSILLFVLAGLLEIGGGYLMSLWLREKWASRFGAFVLVFYGVVSTLSARQFRARLCRLRQRVRDFGDFVGLAD